MINVASKSGTNEYHGVAYLFLQSQVECQLLVEQPDSRAERQIQYDMFGGRWAHIKRDRTFFFMNYEGVRTGNS